MSEPDANCSVSNYQCHRGNSIGVLYTGALQYNKRLRIS